MFQMTSHERFARIFNHKEADRVPIQDSPWRGTIRRWHREGMPEGLDYVDYFDLDLEVKAGMNPIELKRKYGKDLVLHGGVNAVLWDDAKAIQEEIKRVVPVLKESGGYIFASDHSIPNSVSLENFKLIIDLVKTLGSY